MSGSFIGGTGDIFTKCNLLVFACGYLRYHYLQCLRPVTNENFQQQMLYIIERWPLDYMVRLRSATDPIIDAKTNLKIYLDFRVNKLNKLSTLILNFREYLLYSLQNNNTFIWQYDPWTWNIHLVVTGLSTKVSISKSADDTTDRVCGGVGGGGWDGGGGDPVEQEPALPPSSCRSVLLSLWRFEFNRSCIFGEELPVRVDGPPLPSSTWGDSSGRNIANRPGVQGAGSNTCTHKEQLRLPGYLVFSRPVWNGQRECWEIIR